MTFVKTYFKDDEIQARADARKKRRRERGKDKTPAERKKIRKQVYDRDKGICQRCGKYVPLYNKYGKFNLWTCGHAAHIINESQGGSYEVSNLEWTCYHCHEGVGGEHGPQWSKSPGGEPSRSPPGPVSASPPIKEAGR